MTSRASSASHRQLGRVLAVRGEGAAKDLVVLIHGGPGTTPRVATWTGPGSAEVEVGDLVAHGRGDGLGAVGIERVARGPREWPPSGGTPGADLARFLGPRWERLAARSRLLRETREWFHREGFLEVETPLVVPSPGTETHLDPVRVRLSDGPGRESAERWLITSPEYAMKRLIAAGAGPIYQLGKVFRDGERGGRHRPEFTMLEWYRPGAESYEVVMDDCERLVSALAGTNSLSYRGRSYGLAAPWPRHRFFDLLRERADLAHPEGMGPDAWLAALVDRVEATLGVDGPEFVIEWPIELASLARQKPDDPRVAERFELYLAGLELANAFSELTDAAEQRRRCEADNAERRALGKPELPLDEDFLGALAAGLPPSAGIALGFDRLVMLLTDAASIDDVLAF